MSSESERAPDASHSALPPVQAGLRFVIEIAALVCWGGFGSTLSAGSTRWVWALALVVAAAVVWGTFRVPGDLSASGRAPIAVTGLVRLVLEVDILVGAGVLALVFWNRALGAAVIVAAVVHYAATRRRVRWLVGGRSPVAAS